MAYLPGKIGAITIGANTIPASDFSVTSNSDTPDTTNFMDGGFASHAVGMWDAEISFNAFFAGAGYPAEGELISVTVYAVAGGGGITFPFCRVSSVDWSSDAKDVQKVKMTVKTTGAFTFAL